MGFDWEQGDLSPLYGKVDEEIEELKSAHTSEGKDRVEEEMGDLLFAMVNLARHLDVNPDAALTRATRKFAGRFRFVEEQVARSGRLWKSFTLEELEAFWQKAKSGAPFVREETTTGGKSHGESKRRKAKERQRLKR